MSPSGVGFDVGCGNKAVRTELTRADLDELGGLEQIMREVTRRVSFGIGVHFGSRGFGHKTASGFLALAQGLPFDGRAAEGEMDSPPVLLEVGTELGEAYVSAMQLAGEYAYAGRDVVVAKVLEILSAEPVHEVHNHHNFAWREEHLGRSYWVIRKGCTPARPGQEGFVGGSMGDESVIVEGVGFLVIALKLVLH